MADEDTIIGTVELTAQLVETHYGASDGVLHVALGYPLAAAPLSVMRNDVAQTIGIRGVDTGKDCYWSMGDNIVSLDDSATPLSEDDALRIVYVGSFPTAVRFNAKQIARLVAEQLATGVRAATGVRNF